jgi:hypothetical protein
MFDNLYKLLTVLISAGTVMFGVVQWKASVEATARQSLLESKKPFLTLQLDLYVKATRLAAQIANLEESPARASLERDFWHLYWGELGTVENLEVENAMVALGKKIEGKAPPAELRPLSLALAHAVRRSLDQSWEINAWTRQ